MCGIAAAVGWTGAEAAVGTLILGLEHRGEATDPMLVVSSTCALQTRRLRIVDPAGGAQPASSSDGRLVAVMNGEIYNHEALRRELEGLGVVFGSSSDTEVLVNALAVWGPRALLRLDGMFAFLALDLSSGAFLAARDPFGEKPLYLIQNEGGFLFCSEILPLLEASPAGEVLLLPPGYCLTPEGCRPYYRLPQPQTLQARSDPEGLDALLSAAVERRLPPDLPFATFLSGGIDSTLIAHYARRTRPEAPGYFLGGPDAPDHPFVLDYAEASGIDLRFVRLDDDPKGLLSRLEAVAQSVESFEPSVVRPSLCYGALAEAAHRDGLKVVLTGEGADELFCGYGPLELTFAEGHATGAPVREQCLSLMNRSALQRTDRTTMRWGVEARSPFLDLGVAAYALGLSAEALVREPGGGVRGKAPLRALYDLHPGALPRSIRDRAKRPLNEGAGMDQSQTDSDLRRLVEAQISDAEFREGRSLYRAYDLETKEELFYLRALGARMDLSRVPHLKGRLRLEVPDIGRSDGFKAYMA
jgi:asparagine synthase (glutamine-hydrolysing)